MFIYSVFNITHTCSWKLTIYGCYLLRLTFSLLLFLSSLRLSLSHSFSILQHQVAIKIANRNAVLKRQKMYETDPAKQNKRVHEDFMMEVNAMSFLAKRAKERAREGGGPNGGSRGGTAHPHVVSMIECFRDRNAIYLVMEYCSRGELFDVLCASPQERFSESVARRYFRHIVSGEYARKWGWERCESYRDTWNHFFTRLR